VTLAPADFAFLAGLFAGVIAAFVSVLSALLTAAALRFAITSAKLKK
jgi:hypothetical protein